MARERVVICQLGLTYNGVAVPEIPVKIHNRVAGRGVDELPVDIDGNTSLTADNVAADELAGDVC